VDRPRPLVIPILVGNKKKQGTSDDNFFSW
jgi:hypothetical protein